jgi:hypothetical protein
MATKYYPESSTNTQKGEAHRTNSDLTQKAEEAGEIARSLCVPESNLTHIPYSNPTDPSLAVARHYGFDEIGR